MSALVPLTLTPVSSEASSCDTVLLPESPGKRVCTASVPNLEPFGRRHTDEDAFAEILGDVVDVDCARSDATELQSSTSSEEANELRQAINDFEGTADEHMPCEASNAAAATQPPPQLSSWRMAQLVAVAAAGGRIAEVCRSAMEPRKRAREADALDEGCNGTAPSLAASA